MNTRISRSSAVKTAPVAAFLIAALIAGGMNTVRADDPRTMPQIMNGSLSIAFQHGVAAGTVVTTVIGSAKTTTDIAVDKGGVNVVPLNANPQAVLKALESGQTVDIVMKGRKADAEWRIESLVNFTASPAPFLPVRFDGGQDTTGSGSLTASPSGARAEIKFTAEKNNYVAFPVDQPIPSDAVGLGGIVRADAASPVGGLLSLRVKDATGEVFGYACHGLGLDDYSSPESTPLSQIRYRFGGSPGADQKPKTGLPVPPRKVIEILLEPDKWQWAGLMSAYVTDIYVIRQIKSEITALPPSITVMAARSVPGNKSMSGFIGDGEAAGGAAMMAALRPKTWRLGFHYLDDRDRLKTLGVPMIVVLSDLWGYQKSNAPRLDWDKFEARVEAIALDWKPYDTIWDLWNEPDNTGDQFAPSKNIGDFYEIYRHAYRAIRRARGPGIPIEGPSYALYSLPSIRAFLDYCVANNLEVNYLSWHELDKDTNPALIAKDVAEVRQLIAQNPKYRALKISKIQINETVGQSAQYRPGEITGYLYYLEQAGVDGACKGCWWDTSGRMNCFNKSIDGLLDPATNKPRSAYWVYRLYADGAEHRVVSTTSDTRLAPIASLTDGGVQILIGNHSVESGPQAVADPELTITGLSRIKSLHGAKSLTVTIKRLPDSGEAIVEAPLAVGTLTAPITNDSAVVTLPNLGPHEALVVDVSP